jgi:hypothetical protein
LFPGGFVEFGILTSGGTTAAHKIRMLGSHKIELTWGSATIPESTPNYLTVQLQNIRITRTETTPSGTKSTATIQINGAAIWRINRRSKLVCINNAVNFWGYVLGGFLIADTDDEVILAIGLQKTP